MKLRYLLLIAFLVALATLFPFLGTLAQDQAPPPVLRLHRGAFDAAQSTGPPGLQEAAPAGHRHPNTNLDRVRADPNPNP